MNYTVPPVGTAPPGSRGIDRPDGMRKGPQSAQEARKCQKCHSTLPSQRRGRPRKFCTTCVPPGSGAAGIRAWRAANSDRVQAANIARRRGRSLFRKAGVADRRELAFRLALTDSGVG